MKPRSSLLTLMLGLALGAGACGGDNPTLAQQDAGPPDSAPPPNATLTTFVIDLVKNHTSDPTPAAIGTFKDLPDPDGDANNTAAYMGLFQ